MVPQDHHPIPPRSCLFLPKSQFFGTQVPASFPGIRSSSFLVFVLKAREHSPATIANPSTWVLGLVFVLKAREHSPATIANPSTWVLGLVFVLGEGAFPCDHRPSQHMSVGTKAKELSIVTIANPSTWVLGLGSGFVPRFFCSHILNILVPLCLCVKYFPGSTQLQRRRGAYLSSIVRGHSLFLTGIIIDCSKT